MNGREQQNVTWGNRNAEVIPHATTLYDDYREANRFSLTARQFPRACALVARIESMLATVVSGCSRCRVVTFRSTLRSVFFGASPLRTEALQRAADGIPVVLVAFDRLMLGDKFFQNLQRSVEPQSCGFDPFGRSRA